MTIPIHQSETPRWRRTVPIFYFNMALAEGAPLALGPGQHSFPFDVQFPGSSDGTPGRRSIPASSEHLYGHVYYRLKGFLQGAWV